MRPVDGIANPMFSIKDGASNEAVEAVKLNDWISNQDSDPVGNFFGEIGDHLQDFYDQSQVGNQAQAGMVEGFGVNSEINAAINSGLAENPEEAVGLLTGSANDTSEFESNIQEALAGSPSVSDYLKENPNASAEDILKYMASMSDEWAEKWIDYSLEKQSINEANQYTAGREDTAYQRLVQDLKKAGLNPAMMYGSTASTSSSGSAGVVSPSSGANSRSISNYNKIKTLLLAYMLYNIKALTGVGNMVGNGLSNLLSMLLGA